MNQIAGTETFETDAGGGLAGRVASRICHDLVSPLGAIGNGVELLEMTGGGLEEARLVADSATAASARLRLYRIAFGAAAAGRSVDLAELKGALTDPARGARCTLEWGAAGSVERADAKLIALLVMCCEAALPQGGRITVAGPAPWRIAAEGPPRRDPVPWERLAGGGGALASGLVEFECAPLAAEAAGRAIEVEHGDEGVKLRTPRR